MKKLAPTFLILFGIGLLHAQNEAANWYFGVHAGLNFGSGAPVALTDGALNTIEGCSTISDFNGNLLFYTDGITVWNRNHNPMPNGTGLLGHPSSTQSGIIVPHPGNPDQYYVFTVDDSGGPDGLQYNLVDLTLDGGQGDLIAKNVPMETPVTERLTAVAHANGTDIWVLAHKHDSNEFIVYLVTPTGLNTTPIISAVGYTYIADSSQNDARGYMKVSPDGSLLAIATSRNLEILQFNATTGTLSNPLNLYSFITGFDQNYAPFPYGVEFSSDSSRLYASTAYFRNFGDRYYTIHQFDVSVYNAGNIIASGTLISPQQLNSIEALQLAIDGKIYVAQYGQNYLGVIDNPNVLGLGCNYIENGVSLAGRLSGLGLPPFIQSYFVVGLLANNFCFGDATEFSVVTSNPITSISWDFGDGNTSTLETPTNTYAAPGTYTVSATVTTTSETKTETKDITIYETPVANNTSDYEVCSTVPNYQFDLSIKDVEVLDAQLAADNTINYYRTLVDAQNSANVLSNLYTNTNATETIFARISNANNPSCFDTTSFELIVKEAPVLNTVDDWIVCDTDTDGFFDFDLTQKDAEILNGQNPVTFSVSYHTAQADSDGGINSIGPNYTNTTSPQQLFFRIENTTYPECYKTGSFNLEVIIEVQAIDPPDMEVCDTDNDGLFSFDLSVQDNIVLGTQDPANFSVSYYTTQSDADNGTNAVNKSGHTNVSPYTETLYARVENNSNPDCYNTVSFSLRVFDSPILQPVSNWQVCDDDNDGVQTFDLTQKDMEVLGSQSTAQFTVSYHGSQADADANSNAISSPYQNTSNPQTIFYRIENVGNTSCYVTDSIELEVYDSPTAIQPTPFVACDTNETGVQSFDLSQKDAEVLNGQNPATFEVLYFGSQADADANQNALQKTAYSNSALQETIYARIQNMGLDSCYNTTNFELIVNPLPRLDLEETYVICPDSPELTIDGGDFESWSWKDENGIELGTERTIDITDLGDYTLTVSETQNGLSCEKTVDFEIISSGAPDNFTYEIDGFSDVVSIEITVSGTGEFEYSSDGQNYQTSNELEVFPGKHTVYVRDIHECRTISKEIIALGHQKFFTPNGDGANDFWNIVAVENFPESKIYIHDRYGKLLAQLSPLSSGWDGTYQGVEMPSSDYWFRFENEDGTVFTGHFALKR